jgi:hypothetical protein
MLKRSSIFAMAAVAALGATALVPAGASARGHGGPGGAHNGRPMGIVPHRPKPMGIVHGIKIHPRPPMGLKVHPGPIHVGIVVHPHPHPPPIVWWHRHYAPVSAPATTYAPVSASVATTPASCTCLTKQYLDDGSVLFKDICTKEDAIRGPS